LSSDAFLESSMTSVDLEFEQLNSTVDALRRSISNRLMYGVGKDAVTAQPRDWLHAAELAVRDRLRVFCGPSSIFGVLNRTAEEGAAEMLLVEAQDELVKPGKLFKAKAI